MKQARVLTEAELKRVLAVIAQGSYPSRNRLAIMLSHFAGMRVGEIAALTISDVYASDGSVRDQIRLRAEITKGGHARLVFVNGRLRKELERYRDMLDHRQPSSPLLLSQKKSAFTANTLCQRLAQLYAQAGLDGATSHSGRRWFITRLAHSGVSPKVIMTLAGHRNLATTQRYIEVRDEMLKAAVDLL